MALAPNMTLHYRSTRRRRTARIDGGVTLAALQVTLFGQKVAFVYPDSGNIREHLAAIFGGYTYPRATLPESYAPKVVVDIGANIGAAAMFFMSFAPNMRVVCFEPSSGNFAYLKQNLAGFPGVEMYQRGLFREDRSVLLHLGNETCMQHSIVASIETGAGTETIALRSASSEFDRLGLERISILKLDTEGCEVPILENLGLRLDKVDQIYVEYHSEDDRRAIDGILSRRFLLAHSDAQKIHRGIVHYIARDLAESVPHLAAMRLPRPQ